MLPLVRRRCQFLFHREPFKVEFLGLHQKAGAGLRFQTFAGIPVGKPDPTREIVICTISKNGTFSPENLTALTVGSTGTTGIVAGIVQAGNGTSGGRSVDCARIPLPQPWMVTDFNLDFGSGVDDGVWMAVWRIVNRFSINTNQSDNSGGGASSSGTSVSANGTTIKPLGFMVGIGCNDGPNTISVSGADLLTQRSDGDVIAAAVSLPPQVDAVTPTATWSWSGSTGNLCRTWAFDFAT